MTKFAAIIILVISCWVSCIAQSQSYLGFAKTGVNLRKDHNTNSKVLRVLQRGDALFLIEKAKKNGYYHVINIETDQEGYVHSNYVQIEKKLPPRKEGVFKKTGKVDHYNPKATIFNDTDLSMTLKLNQKVYHFEPQERKTFTLTPGSYEYRASAPGVIPDYGREDLKSNYEYEWKFYIETDYNSIR